MFRMDEHLLQATEMILENIITSPEERWKALTDRDSTGMTPVHLLLANGLEAFRGFDLLPCPQLFPRTRMLSWRRNAVSINMF